MLPFIYDTGPLFYRVSESASGLSLRLLFARFHSPLAAFEALISTVNFCVITLVFRTDESQSSSLNQVQNRSLQSFNSPNHYDGNLFCCFVPTTASLLMKSSRVTASCVFSCADSSVLRGQLQPERRLVQSLLPPPLCLPHLLPVYGSPPGEVGPGAFRLLRYALV